MEAHFHFTVLGMNFRDRMHILQEILGSLGRRDSIRLEVNSEPQPQPQHQPPQQVIPENVDNTLREQNCMICFGTPNRVTPCSHRGCLGCIEPWLRRHNTCPDPFCRRACSVTDLTPI